jgi:hypothetical protein
MAEIALIGGLTALGYYLNRDGRTKKKQVNSGLVHVSELPSGDNIYQSRFMEKVFDDEFQRASANYKAARNPMKTGVINSGDFKKYPNNKYDKRIYTKSDRVVQAERDLKRAEPDTSTRIPSSSLNVYDTSFNLIDNDKVVSEGTKSFNERRNNMPNPEFEDYPTGDNQRIFRTVFSNDRKDGKSVKIFNEGSHNNMEPFFGSSVKQNTRSNANRTLLENYTGTNTLFKHKKEVKRMFPVVKNPYAVGGMPVANNREVDRYIPSIKKQNILPFEQKRVAPGLNKSMVDDTSKIGFHDSYRPLGQGKYKPVNELRVNPKITYKGRIAGEGFFVAKGQKARPVVSRQPVDLSYTTFTPGSNDKDGVSTNYKYRENIVTGTQIIKGEVNDKNTIILRNTDRQDYADRIGNLQGHSRDENQRGQVYSYDNAKSTIKQSTQDHIHNHINTISEVNRNIVNPYDDARSTIKQSTQDNIHNRINPGNDQRMQTYSWDKSKETIKEQTEDNIHNRINPGNDQRMQTYSWDKSKETIKEQTEDHLHNRINRGSSQARVQNNRSNYENANINALKEHTLHRRKPTQEGAKAIGGKNLWNNDVRRTQFSTYDKTRSVAPTARRFIDKRQIGQVTKQGAQYADKSLNESRIHPVFVDQFNKNPYTQKLTSHIIPYNPAYPRK